MSFLYKFQSIILIILSDTYKAFAELQMKLLDQLHQWFLTGLASRPTITQIQAVDKSLAMKNC